MPKGFLIVLENFTVALVVGGRGGFSRHRKARQSTLFTNLFIKSRT